MSSQLLSALVATVLVIIISLFITRYLRSSLIPVAEKQERLDLTNDASEPTMLTRSLASALPDSVIIPRDAVTFKQSMNSYWAEQECEVIPASVVRPRNVQQLGKAIRILKSGYDEQAKQAGGMKAEGLFAVRGGGHSPVPGAASIKGGILVDLGHFCEVKPSEDGSSVGIGAGAKWSDISKALDPRGLAVVGGRNSAVGVGGLTLGGKLLCLAFILAFSDTRPLVEL